LNECIDKTHSEESANICLADGVGYLCWAAVAIRPASALQFPREIRGDSLWALMVFLCFGFAFRRSSTWRISLAAVCFAWSVELLQLYHAPWIDVVRSTRPGQLVLGSSFNSPDLIAYAAGIAVGALGECVYFHETQKANQKT